MSVGATSEVVDLAGEDFFDRDSAAFLRDPYPRYRELWRLGRALRGPLGGIALTRWADCQAAVRDARLSSDPRHRVDGRRAGASSAPEPGSPAGFLEISPRVMLFMDPPDHTRLRKLVSQAFTPRAVERLAPRIRVLVDDLLDPVAGEAHFDVMATLAYPLPVIVICELLGVPPGDREQFKAWSGDATRLLDVIDEDADSEILQRGVLAAAQILQYLGGLIEERRASPRDDLLSAMIAAEEAGDRLTQEELFATCILLFLAGHETTMNLIGNGVLALLRHPDQRRRLLDDPSLTPTAVEEVLRYDAPVQVTGRTATEDVEINGLVVPKGQQLVCLLAGANRDPDQFPEPDQFDVGRVDNRHLAFGGGIHYCLGAALARLEGQITIDALVRRFPEMELAADEVHYREHFVLRGLRALPIATG